jgi:hypothetical protein
MAYPYERMRQDALVNDDISSGMIVDLKTREVLQRFDDERRHCIRQPEVTGLVADRMSSHSFELEDDRLFLNMYWMVREALTR